MALAIHWKLLFSRLVCFATTLMSLITYTSHSTSGLIRVSVFGYMYQSLMVLISVCSVELFGQGLTMYFGSTAPVPVHPVLCLLLLLGDWVLALMVVGWACASLSLLEFFMANGVFDTSVNVRAIIHCVLSLLAGASAVATAFLSLQIVKARYRASRAQG